MKKIKIKPKIQKANITYQYKFIGLLSKYIGVQCTNIMLLLLSACVCACLYVVCMLTMLTFPFM